MRHANDAFIIQKAGLPVQSATCHDGLHWWLRGAVVTDSSSGGRSEQLRPAWVTEDWFLVGSPTRRCLGVGLWASLPDYCREHRSLVRLALVSEGQQDHPHRALRDSRTRSVQGPTLLLLLVDSQQH